MNSRIATRACALAVAGALMVALAGCGGSDDNKTGNQASASASGHQPADQREAALAFSECMRANGQPDFPDPVQDERGRWGPPSSLGPLHPPAACQGIMKGGEPDGTRLPTAADMTKLRQFAACMRSSGIDGFPDPDDKGVFSIPPAVGSLMHSKGEAGLDAIQKPCEKQLPEGWRLHMEDA